MINEKTKKSTRSNNASSLPVITLHSTKKTIRLSNANSSSSTPTISQKLEPASSAKKESSALL